MGLANPLHIAVLVLLLVVVFGARRLPEVGRSLGSGLREFKGSLTGGSDTPPAALTEPPAGPDQRR
jgi:sec-independent protein translocase protein TatA